MGDGHSGMSIGITKSDGGRVDIKRYFKSDDWIDNDWVEISHDDYVERYRKLIQ